MLTRSVHHTENGGYVHISCLLLQHNLDFEGPPSVFEPGTPALRLVKAKGKLWDFTTCDGSPSETQRLANPIGPSIAGEQYSFILVSTYIQALRHLKSYSSA
jgi:hypothetical protein